jgi:hypothetical protein
MNTPNGIPDDFFHERDTREETRMVRDEAIRLREQFEVFIFRLDAILKREDEDSEQHGHH